MSDEYSDPENESTSLAAQGLRLMRLFHSLTSQQDRDNFFRVVEAFVQTIRNREPK